MSASFICNYEDSDNRYKQEVENIIPSVHVSVNYAGRMSAYQGQPLTVRE